MRPPTYIPSHAAPFIVKEIVKRHGVSVQRATFLVWEQQALLNRRQADINAFRAEERMKAENRFARPPSRPIMSFSPQ